MDTLCMMVRKNCEVPLPALCEFAGLFLQRFLFFNMQRSVTVGWPSNPIEAMGAIRAVSNLVLWYLRFVEDELGSGFDICGLFSFIKETLNQLKKTSRGRSRYCKSHCPMSSATSSWRRTPQPAPPPRSHPLQAPSLSCSTTPFIPLHQASPHSSGAGGLRMSVINSRRLVRPAARRC